MIDRRWSCLFVPLLAILMTACSGRDRDYRADIYYNYEYSEYDSSLTQEIMTIIWKVGTSSGASFSPTSSGAITSPLPGCKVWIDGTKLDGNGQGGYYTNDMENEPFWGRTVEVKFDPPRDDLTRASAYFIDLPIEEMNLPDTLVSGENVELTLPSNLREAYLALYASQESTTIIGYLHDGYTIPDSLAGHTAKLKVFLSGEGHEEKYGNTEVFPEFSFKWVKPVVIQ